MISYHTINCLLVLHTAAAAEAVVPAAKRDVIVRLLLCRLVVGATLLAGEANRVCMSRTILLQAATRMKPNTERTITDKRTTKK